MAQETELRPDIAGHTEVNEKAALYFGYAVTQVDHCFILFKNRKIQHRKIVLKREQSSSCKKLHIKQARQKQPFITLPAL